ncbi:MAG: phosphatase PAP2 family protein [Bacteroidia bacterium]|jgi:membrane-associated phospholipid phosphatase|nr:phosphatase PAP2 family protein [Bacteroidia bacterium]
MKTFIKDNKVFLILYTLLIATSAYYLLNFDKVQIHLNINKLTGNPIMDVFFKYFTHIGDGLVAIVIAVIIILFNARNGLYILTAYLTSGITTTLLKKHIYDIDRPHFVFHEYLYHYKVNYIEGVDMLGMRSFPSGHSTSAFAIFISLALITENKILKFIFFAIAFLAAFSRTYLSQHWLVDITVGSIIGTSFAILFYFIFINPNKFQKLDKPLFKIFNP